MVVNLFTLLVGPNAWVISSPPASVKACRLTVGGALWVGNASVDLDIRYSYDGGATYPGDGAVTSVSIGQLDAAKKAFLQCGLKHTAAQMAVDGIGYVVPTHAKGTVTLHALASLSTDVTLEWL